jgi:hypothetical protein
VLRRHGSHNFREKFLPPAVATAPATATTTAATAATTIPAIAATAATTTASAFGFGSRLIDVDGASTDRGSIQSRDRLLAVFVASHLNESEATGAPGVAVRHDAYAVHLPEGFKDLPQFVFVRVEAQISNKNILHASASALSCRSASNSADLAGREDLPENRDRS